MKPFVLHLQSATQYERFENVVSFVGEDESGRFGILAGHERMLTILVFGLARFRTTDGVWHYLALPGGLVYFVGGELILSTRRYLHDPDSARIAAALREQLAVEEESLRDMKLALRQMENEMLRRLKELGRSGGTLP